MLPFRMFIGIHQQLKYYWIAGSVFISIFVICILTIMSELFHSYQQQFIKALTIINKKTQSIAVQSNQKKQLAFTDIRGDLSDAEKCIKLMETQIIGLQSHIKMNFQQKIRSYKKDYDDAKKKLYREQQQFSIEKSKQALMNAELDSQSRTTKYRQSLMETGQEMSNTTYKLKQSVMVMHQNLQISENVGQQLHDHSNRLLANKSKLGIIRDDLKTGEKRIKSMMMRIRRNKFILAAVFAVIMLIGVIILAIKLTSA